MREHWHPLLFAISPVLFLYAHNSANLPVEVLGRPLLAALILGITALVLARIVVIDAARGALLASAMMLQWATYGYVLALLSAAGSVGEALGHHRVIMPLGIILLSMLIIALRRGRPGLAWTRYLSLAARGMSLSLVALSLLMISTGMWQDAHRRSAEGELIDPAAATRPILNPSEDIYHIVLDGYPRADVLDDLYGLDNGPFLAALRTRGFCVADSARSNYAQTLLSVVSTLTGRYFEEPDVSANEGEVFRRHLARRLKEVLRRRSLVVDGAWTRAFATGYSATEILDADVYQGPAISLNEFERALVAMTPLDALLNLVESRHGDVLHRRRVEFTFENLPVPSGAPPRAFTFAHIIAPHPPFVFAPVKAAAGAVVPLGDGDHIVHGGGLSVEQYRQAYRGQVKAVNELLLKAVDAILMNGRPSVILVHGDHGPGSLLKWEDTVPDAAAAHERFGILLAIRMSDGDTNACWPSMSPVNAVRMIENSLYGTRRDTLPDLSFFSTWSRPFDFVEIYRSATAVDVPDDTLSNETTSATGIQMIRVAPGTFMMGSPLSESGRDDSELQHKVTLSRGFWLGKTEVTQRQWKAVMGNNPSMLKGNDLPVEKVSWHDCVSFCNALSELEGLTPAYGISGESVTWDKSADGYRLPTEAEWEYACRAGTTGPFAGDLDEMAIYSLNSGRKTRGAGTRKANAWGFHDMHGNVLEWCWDRFKRDYGAGWVMDPTGPDEGLYRIERGGSWHLNPRGCRSASRGTDISGARSNSLGFRVSRY